MTEREVIGMRRDAIARLRAANVRDPVLTYWWIETELHDDQPHSAYNDVFSASPEALRVYEARSLRDDGIAYISGRWDGAGRKLNVTHMRAPELDREFLDYYGFREHVGEEVGTRMRGEVVVG